MSGQTEEAHQLPSFEEFIEPSVPPSFEEAASRLAPYVDNIDSDAVAEFYIGDIPGHTVSEKAEKLAYDLPKIDDKFDADLFDHAALNAVYGLSRQTNVERTEAWVPTDLRDSQIDHMGYDNIVLDHSPICRILADESYKYTTESGEEHTFDASDITAFIDYVAETDTEIFTPSDLREKYETPDIYASAESVPIYHAMIDHLESIATPYDIDRVIDVPSEHQDMKEDYGIGSAADDLEGETAILAFDGDFTTIEKEYDVDAVIPPLPEY